MLDKSDQHSARAPRVLILIHVLQVGGGKGGCVCLRPPTAPLFFLPALYFQKHPDHALLTTPSLAISYMLSLPCMLRKCGWNPPNSFVLQPYTSVKNHNHALQMTRSLSIIQTFSSPSMLCKFVGAWRGACAAPLSHCFFFFVRFSNARQSYQNPARTSLFSSPSMLFNY